MPSSTRDALGEARHYAKLIKHTAQQCTPGPMRERLMQTIRPVDEWLVNLQRLEQSLQKLYAQRNLSRELRKVDFEINQLKREMLGADEGEFGSLRKLVKSKEYHRSTLRELQAFQTQAELKIRRIASDLGATHAEMLLITARGDFSESRFRRLDENLQDNLSSLRDMISVMDEINYTRSVAG